jgi:hypothetical protein
MKGYFSLHCDSFSGEIYFGKLLLGGIGAVGNLSDEESNVAMVSRLIAHDVVEHSVSHRTDKSVSWENEIRAFGAISYVREGEGHDLWSEVAEMCECLNRDIKPVPYIVGKFLLKGHHVEVDFMRALVKYGISPKNARNIAYQFAWGRCQKEQQFGFQQWSARSAFSFIESNIPHLLKSMCYEDYPFTGVSVYFDSLKHVFRWKFKRQ